MFAACVCVLHFAVQNFCTPQSDMAKMSNSTWTIFPAVQSSQLVDLLDTTNICDQDNAQIEKLIKRHLFSQSIQLISQSDQLFQAVQNVVIENNEFAYLLLRDMPWYALICPYFLDAYCRKGTLHGVSVNRDVNLDDTVALLPNKILLLSLNVETYYRLGIIGQKSTLNAKKNIVEKYRITIELGKDYFKPDKKNYQRVLECLQRSKLKCDFVIKWKPHDANISPNSLVQYFDYVKENCKDDPLLSNMSIQKCYPTMRTYTNLSIAAFPNLNDDKPNENLEKRFQQFIEWISCQIAEVKYDDICGESNEFCDTYCVEINGFFTSTNISTLMHQLKTYFSNQDIGAIVMHGFEDSPQCWSGRNNEHYKDVSGENVFGIGQLKGKVVSWCITDRFDFGIEKL